MRFSFAILLSASGLIFPGISRAELIDSFPSSNGGGGARPVRSNSPSPASGPKTPTPQTSGFEGLPSFATQPAGSHAAATESKPVGTESGRAAEPSRAGAGANQWLETPCAEAVISPETVQTESGLAYSGRYYLFGFASSGSVEFCYNGHNECQAEGASWYAGTPNKAADGRDTFHSPFVLQDDIYFTYRVKDATGALACTQTFHYSSAPEPRIESVGNAVARNSAPATEGSAPTTTTPVSAPHQAGAAATSQSGIPATPTSQPGAAATPQAQAGGGSAVTTGPAPEPVPAVDPWLGPIPPAIHLSPEETELIRSTNYARYRNGQPLLRVDANATLACQWQAANMSSQGNIWHSSSPARGGRAENVGMIPYGGGTTTDIGNSHTNAYRASYGHWVNIVNATVGIGVGIRWGKKNYGGYLFDYSYSCQQFTGIGGSAAFNPGRATGGYPTQGYPTTGRRRWGRRR